jgi:predicted XRE-type DNA-binding protein
LKLPKYSITYAIDKLVQMLSQAGRDVRILVTSQIDRLQ